MNIIRLLLVMGLGALALFLAGCFSHSTNYGKTIAYKPTLIDLLKQKKVESYELFKKSSGSQELWIEIKEKDPKTGQFAKYKISGLPNLTDEELNKLFIEQGNVRSGQIHYPESLVVQWLPLISLLCLVFWIWMLIDCVRNELIQGNEKIMWVLIIIFTSIIGAVLYFIYSRPRQMRKATT